MKKQIYTTLYLGALAFCLLTGCSKNQESESKPKATETATPTPVATRTETPTPTSTPTEKPKPELPAIGIKSENGYQIQLKNSTGIAITGVSIATDEEEFSTNLLAEADVFAIDEERYLYYPPIETAAQSTDAAEPEEKLLGPAYNIQLTFENDMVLILHSFPFGDIETGEIYAQDSVAFLRYESLSSKELVDTKEAELAILVDEEAAREAQAQAEAEAAAQQQEQYFEEEYDDSYTYTEPSYDDYSYEEPSYDDGSGSDDSCLDGGLLY